MEQYNEEERAKIKEQVTDQLAEQIGAMLLVKGMSPRQIAERILEWTGQASVETSQEMSKEAFEKGAEYVLGLSRKERRVLKKAMQMKAEGKI